MSNDSTNDAEDDLKEKFGELFETSNGDMITRVCKSIEKLRKLSDLKKEEKCNEHSFYLIAKVWQKHFAFLL